MERDAFMPPAHTGGGTHNVQNEEEVLHVLHVNPSTGAQWATYEMSL
jgi:hypothetical protein